MSYAATMGARQQRFAGARFGFGDAFSDMNAATDASYTAQVAYDNPTDANVQAANDAAAAAGDPSASLSWGPNGGNTTPYTPSSAMGGATAGGPAVQAQNANPGLASGIFGAIGSLFGAVPAVVNAVNGPSAKPGQLVKPGQKPGGATSGMSTGTTLALVGVAALGVFFLTRRPT